MAGSIQNMAALYNSKSFTYISPNPLMESTNFTINFKSRKFVHVGIDPTDKFNVTIHILTSSRHVNITNFFLMQIFSLMGYILAFVLDKPQKCRRTTFFDNEAYKLSCMTHKGESMLVIESKFHIGCRVLLNRADLMQLQNLECAIRETIERKREYTCFILKQVEELVVYLDEKLTQVDSPPKNLYEMKIFIKNVQFDKVITSVLNLASQLKIYADTQLAELWEKRRSMQSSQKVF